MSDPEIILRLPQSVLDTVLRHLYGGRYSDVLEAVQCICSQAAPQFTNLAKIAEAEAAPAMTDRKQ
jgi:hypothetical protein